MQANEPDTLYYQVFSTKENEVVVMEGYVHVMGGCLMLICVYRYRTMAAAQAHARKPYFKEFIAKVPPLVSRPMEMKMGAQVSGSARVLRI